MRASAYIKKRKKTDAEFVKEYDSGLSDLKLACLLKEARKEACMTQEELAEKIGTKRSAISRMERHATDIKVSTLEKIAHALGRQISINFS